MSFDPQTGKRNVSDTPMEHSQQVILPSNVDNELQPDALRGSEWVFNHLKDGDGNQIEVDNKEQARRDFQRQAVESGAQLRVQSPAILSQEPQRKSGTPIEESDPMRRESQEALPFNARPSAPQSITNDPVTNQPIGTGEPQNPSDTDPNVPAV